jgi:integrase
MASIKLQYVKAYRDRHGRPRHYFRRRGSKPVALPGAPGGADFMEAYAAALSDGNNVPIIGASHTQAGTVAAMVVGYLGSAAFQGLRESSQQQYRRILEGLRREHGDKRWSALERKHIVHMLDAKAATPTAARDFLRCLRLLVEYGMAIGIRQDDPTARVRVKVPKSDGYRTWSEDDIVAFETAYPVGSRPRLALALLLGTALRCADVVRVGRGNVRSGTLHVTQQKTGTKLAIPITAALAEAINAVPSEAMVFLLNDRGGAFTAKGFGKWFTAQCQRVGLNGLSPHGLRKAACRRLAEAGCSANEIAAISGHASLREVERYTKAADQARMARNAMARTEGQQRVSNLPTESV